MSKIDDAEVYAVYGRRGTGKSYLVNKLMRGFPRVIIFDPLDEYGKKQGVTRVKSLPQLEKTAIKKWPTGFKITYPVTKNYPEELHLLSEWIWDQREKASSKILLIVEEMNLSYPSITHKSAHFGFPKLIMQGRKRGVEIFGVTQRPNRVHGDFRSAVSKSYIFPMEEDGDIDFVRKRIGRKNLPDYLNMPKYHHVQVGGGNFKITKI